jgi:hypothetical protein
MRERIFIFVVGMAVLVMVPFLVLSQAAPQNLTLNLNGHPYQVPITQMNGHSYVEINALAQAANGTISYPGKQMTLTLPGRAVEVTAAAAPTSSPTAVADPGFSKDFMRSAIEAMAAVREWRSVLTNGVQNGYPIMSLGLANYRAQASQSLRLASVAVTTDSDRNAFQLCTNEFENMKKLSDKMIAAAQNMTYIAPDALTTDPLDQKILGCARSLAAMASSGQFMDDGSCH